MDGCSGHGALSAPALLSRVLRGYLGTALSLRQHGACASDGYHQHWIDASMRPFGLPESTTGLDSCRYVHL